MVALLGNPPSEISFEVDPTYGGITFTIIITAIIGNSNKTTKTFTIIRPIIPIPIPDF